MPGHSLFSVAMDTELTCITVENHFFTFLFTLQGVKSLTRDHESKSQAKDPNRVRQSRLRVCESSEAVLNVRFRSSEAAIN